VEQSTQKVVFLTPPTRPRVSDSVVARNAAWIAGLTDLGCTH